MAPQLLLYTRTIEKFPKINSYYFSPFANTDVTCFFVCSLVPGGRGGLLANISASLASSMSFSLKKLGWFVEDSSLAHILSVILTLFRVDVTLCCPNKLQVILMLRKYSVCIRGEESSQHYVPGKLILIVDLPKLFFPLISCTLTHLGRPEIKFFFQLSFNPRSANFIQLCTRKMQTKGRALWVLTSGI